MKFSVRAFLSEAFSTSSRMRLTVDWSKGLVTRTVSMPVMFTQPDTTSSPAPATLGTDSPVSDEVSSWLAPSTTTPSRGTRSPGLTTMRSPGESS